MKRAIAPRTVAALLFGCSTLLAGCATESGYPSLAKRPQEEALEASTAAPTRITGGGAPAAPAPDAVATQQAVSADLSARLAELRDSARAAHDRFVGKRATTARLVGAAAGAAPASEAWSQATVAIADLQSARSDAMVSLGELDRLYVAERIDGGDGGAIAAVRDQVSAWVADEDAVLAELGGRLRG